MPEYRVFQQDVFVGATEEEPLYIPPDAVHAVVESTGKNKARVTALIPVESEGEESDE